MKPFIRSAIINLAALYVSVAIVPGFTNEGGIQTLILAIAVLAVMNLLIRPIISLLLLPINVITLGAFRWLINVAMLAILTMVVTKLKLSSFSVPGFTYQGFVIPEFEVSRLGSLILSSLAISTTNAFLFWLARDE